MSSLLKKASTGVFVFVWLSALFMYRPPIIPTGYSSCGYSYKLAAGRGTSDSCKKQHGDTVICTVMIQKNALNMHCITSQMNYVQFLKQNGVQANVWCKCYHEESISFKCSYSGYFTPWHVATVEVQWQEALMMIKGNEPPKLINIACRFIFVYVEFYFLPPCLWYWCF